MTPRLPNFLRTERSLLERLLPGLDSELASLPLSRLEQAGSPAIEGFRQLGGPALLVPVGCGGHGIGLLEALRVQRAIGARAPSLAVATTMHHFTVFALARQDAVQSLLTSVARDQLYLASGFAEGRRASGTFSSAIQVEHSGGGLRISGSKKPCSLSASFDLLTASLCLPDGRFAVALIPASSPGLTRRPFWNTPILAGAESDEILLDRVYVPQDQLLLLDDELLDGYLAFELMISAAYLGMASGLVEQVLIRQRGIPSERVALAIELESAMAALEGVAHAVVAGEPAEWQMVRALLVRSAAQAAIERAAGRAAELLGGLRFIGSGDVSYLLAACRALAFHPPSRLQVAQPLDDYLAGGELCLV